MEEENDRGDNLNVFKENRSSAEMITNDVGALRGILSKMEFGELLKARLVSKTWNKETGFFIKNRIDWINLSKDSRLEQYSKSEDRPFFPSIKLNLRNLSTRVLAKCGLEGVQNLCLRAIGYYYAGEPDWNVKEKILNLLQPPNNINSIMLHFRYPVNFTNMEADFVHNLVNLRSLSLILDGTHEHCYLGPNGIGSVLITRSASLQYLKAKVDYSMWYLNGFLTDLTEQLNGRKENGYSNLILSILPEIEVKLKSCDKFNQFANCGARFETLKLGIKFKKHATQQQLNETFKAAATILENSADIFKKFHFSFAYQGCQSTDEFQLKVPSIPKLQKLQLRVSVKGNPGANLKAEQFYQLPDVFPSLKKLVVANNEDMIAFRGKTLPNLEILTYAKEYGQYRTYKVLNNIPYPPPTFPSLRAVVCNNEVTEEFLQFVFTNCTSIQELKIMLQRRAYRIRYLDFWDIFTGSAQPPPNVAPPVCTECDSDDEYHSDDQFDSDDHFDSDNQFDSVDEDENDEDDEVAGNPVNDEDNVEEHIVASLENFTNLRELEIINATLRDIQAVTYMTELKKIPKLDNLSFKVRIYKEAINWDKYNECFDILKGYHRRVVASV